MEPSASRESTAPRLAPRPEDTPLPEPPLAPPDGNGQFESKELDEQLEHADRLIAYAAEVGIDVSAHHLAVLRAKQETGGRWTIPLATDFLVALTAISRATRPVTGDSLKACVSDQAGRQTRYFAYWMWGLFPVIVLFSIGDFYVSKLCEQIQTDLTAAQTLAVELNDRLFRGSESATERAPVRQDSLNQSEIIQDLTQFAALTRSIHAHTDKLNWFTVPRTAAPLSGPRELELDPKLANLSDQTVLAIERYQNVRHFAQTVRTDASVLYGALLQCALPMMYAILGTLAFLLRKFDAELSARTFSEKGMHTARFATAAIGGIVVGLFNLDLTAAGSHGAKVSPLAIAFMVGYAVDVFFNFVETLVGAFVRRVPIASAPPKLPDAK